MRETRRCANQRKKIIALMTQTLEHVDPNSAKKIREFVHQILNLAADKSALGAEPIAKHLEKMLTRALKCLAAGTVSPAQTLKEIQS